MHLSDNTLLQGGKYRIVRFISQGGFGCTYEGVHSMMNSRVAIKEFFVEDFYNRDPDSGEVSIGTQGKKELAQKLRKAFLREAQSVFKMHHPGIVRVIDVFEENGTAYYVMDYIDGSSLQQIVKQRGKLPEHEAVEYIRQVAEALKYVHNQDRLHLDIKPGNIMVDKNGNAVLIDFGASKHYDSQTHEQTSTLLGMNTKGYAPTEQMSSSFTDFNPATDIYALGATLYKLLTGVTPPDSICLMNREETLTPLSGEFSEATRLAVKSAMIPYRKQRPQSIAQFLEILTGQIKAPKKVSKVPKNDEPTDLDDDTNVTIFTGTGKTDSGKAKDKGIVVTGSKYTPGALSTDSNKKNLTWIWFMLGGLILAALIVIVILLVSNPTTTSSEESASPTETHATMEQEMEAAEDSGE